MEIHTRPFHRSNWQKSSVIPNLALWFSWKPILLFCGTLKAWGPATLAQSRGREKSSRGKIAIKRLVAIRLRGGPRAGLAMKLDSAPEVIGLGNPVWRYERVAVKGSTAEYRYRGEIRGRSDQKGAQDP